MTEIWRAVPGLVGYEASNLGSVRSLRRHQPCILKPSLDHGGYRMVFPSVDGQNRTYAIHRMVLLAFVGPRPPGMQIRHLDGDRSNNCLSNLRYGTPSENVQDAVRHGTRANLGRTHCAHGHPFDEGNTYWYGTTRNCRACNRRAAAETKRRRRAAAQGLLVGEVL